MLKSQTESKQYLERLKYLLSINKDCKVKPDIKKKWNKNIDFLIADAQVQNLAKDLSKYSNNNSKLNMLIVSLKIIKYVSYINM